MGGGDYYGLRSMYSLIFACMFLYLLVLVYVCLVLIVFTFEFKCVCFTRPFFIPVVHYSVLKHTVVCLSVSGVS